MLYISLLSQPQKNTLVLSTDFFFLVMLLITDLLPSHLLLLARDFSLPTQLLYHKVTPSREKLPSEDKGCEGKSSPSYTLPHVPRIFGQI